MSNVLRLDYDKMKHKYVSEHFYEAFDTDKRFIILRGGRSSTKSTVACTKLIMDFLADPLANMVVVQKEYAHIRNQSFSEIQKVIDRMGLTTLFKYYTSPFRIVRRDTGTAIIFLGCEDPVKIKGFTVPKGYIHTVWYEEVQRMNHDDVFVSWDTFVRNKPPGGVRMLLSFNPPYGSMHWLNQFADEKMYDNQWLVNHSTYLDVRTEFLSEEQLAVIEHKKETDAAYYNFHYLGKVTEGGTQVYNMDYMPFVKEIPEGWELTLIEISIDTGYSISACAMIAVGYLREKRLYDPFERMYARTNGGAQYKPMNTILLDTWYFDPTKEGMIADSGFYAEALEQFVRKLEKTYDGARVNHDIIVDPADANFRSHLRNRTRFSTQSPNKSSKLEMIELTKQFLGQQRFMILDIPANIVFYREHAGYVWKEDAYLSDNPKVEKQRDHTCDAFMYWVQRAERNHSLIRNWIAPKPVEKKWWEQNTL